MAYYLETHMPASIERLSVARIRRGSVDRGVGGGAPGAPAAYVAMCQYLFETADVFMAAIGPHAEFLKATSQLHRHRAGHPVQ